MSCRAVLSIGSNVGDSLGILRGVIDSARTDGLLLAASAVYATSPWGGVEQDDFLNVTMLVEGFDTAGDWLAWAQAREAAAHRTRDVRWGPRTLDVDVVTVAVDGREIRSDDPVLTLPHPRAHERAFVLVPWLDVDRDARLAEVAVRELVDRLGPEEVAGVRRLDPRAPGARGGVAE